MGVVKACYVHGGPRVEPDDPEDGCQHDVCVELRNLPKPTEPVWKIGWLKESNRYGQTAREMRDEIYENARQDGRDIQKA